MEPEEYLKYLDELEKESQPEKEFAKAAATFERMEEAARIEQQRRIRESLKRLVARVRQQAFLEGLAAAGEDF